jgi:hypothetical protein
MPGYPLRVPDGWCGYNACAASFTTQLGVDCTIQFTDQSTGSVCIKECEEEEESIVSWLWDFGDGDTSTQQNPSHQFEELSGGWDVSLTVTDSMGCTHTWVRKVVCRCTDLWFDYMEITLTGAVGDCAVFNGTHIADPEPNREMALIGQVNWGEDGTFLYIVAEDGPMFLGVHFHCAGSGVTGWAGTAIIGNKNNLLNDPWQGGFGATELSGELVWVTGFPEPDVCDGSVATMTFTMPRGWAATA